MITIRHTLQGIIALSMVLPTISLAASSTTATSTKMAASSTVATTSTPAPAPKAAESALPAAAQARIKDLAANISNKQDAMVRRLINVTTRLESRLTIMETNGSNVIAARNNLNEAKASLTKAQESLNTIDKAVTNFIGSATPRESWSSLKLTYADINKNIRVAYDALVAAVATATMSTLTTTAITGTTTATTSPAL